MYPFFLQVQGSKLTFYVCHLWPLHCCHFTASEFSLVTAFRCPVPPSSSSGEIGIARFEKSDFHFMKMLLQSPSRVPPPGAQAIQALREQNTQHGGILEPRFSSEITESRSWARSRRSSFCIPVRVRWRDEQVQFGQAQGWVITSSGNTADSRPSSFVASQA